MNAMVLKALSRLAENRDPLQLAGLPVPVPGAEDLLVKVAACGVCHSELKERKIRGAKALRIV